MQTLTITEVIHELEGRKEYVGIMSRALYLNTISRIKAGTSKRSTIRQFFTALGYEGDHNEWRKTQLKQPKVILSLHGHAFSRVG